MAYLRPDDLTAGDVVRAKWARTSRGNWIAYETHEHIGATDGAEIGPQHYEIGYAMLGLGATRKQRA